MPRHTIPRPTPAEHSKAPSSAVQRRRAVIDRVLQFAEHLQPAERSLLRCAYDWGVNSREIALLTGLQPRTVRKRIKALLKRVNSAKFKRVLPLVPHFPEPRRTIAQLVILRGMRQRDAAIHLGLTVHQVRRELVHIDATCDAAEDNQQIHDLVASRRS